MATESLGKTIKRLRLEQKLTQVELARDICAQSMISAIEHDQYMPNAALLATLCERLKLSLDTLSLVANYAISGTNDVNLKLSALCNDHQYQALFDFLEKSATRQSVGTDEALNAYYYYLGVAKLQAKRDLVGAMASFSMAVADQRHQLSALDRLAYASRGVVHYQRYENQLGGEDFTRAFEGLASARYEENLNILFYLRGLESFIEQDRENAQKWVQQGIQFTSQHNSHYLLGNDYYLLAVITRASGDYQRQHEASGRADTFSSLFGEVLYTDFPDAEKS